MKILHGIAAQPQRLRTFLGLFQPPAVRLTHALIILFVLIQFASGPLMWVWAGGASWLGWLHMWSGASLVALTALLTVLSFRRYGIKYFFPYIWGDTAQLRHDLRETLRRKLVPPRPGGLGAAVQGLGLGALWLVAGSGLIWFALWQEGSEAAPFWRAAHDWLSLLVLLYFIGHGGMALLHFAEWQRKLEREHHSPDDVRGGSGP